MKAGAAECKAVSTFVAERELIKMFNGAVRRQNKYTLNELIVIVNANATGPHCTMKESASFISVPLCFLHLTQTPPPPFA